MLESQAEVRAIPQRATFREFTRHARNTVVDFVEPPDSIDLLFRSQTFIGPDNTDTDGQLVRERVQELEQPVTGPFTKIV